MQTEENREHAVNLLAGNVRRKMNQDKNIKREHWNTCSTSQLLSLLKIEVKELEHAIEFETNREVVNEAADIGAYCAMIIDNMTMDRSATTCKDCGLTTCDCVRSKG